MKKNMASYHETLSKGKITSELPSIFYHNVVELTNPTEIANAFNLNCSKIN